MNYLHFFEENQVVWTDQGAVPPAAATTACFRPDPVRQHEPCASQCTPCHPQSMAAHTSTACGQHTALHVRSAASCCDPTQLRRQDSSCQPWAKGVQTGNLPAALGSKGAPTYRKETACVWTGAHTLSACPKMAMCQIS